MIHFGWRKLKVGGPDPNLLAAHRRAVAAEMRAEELLFLLRRALRWVDSCPVITSRDRRDWDIFFARLDQLDIQAEAVPRRTSHE